MGSRGLRPWLPITGQGRHSTIHTHAKFSHTTPCKHVSNILYCTGSPSNYALHYVSRIMALYWYECHSWHSISFCPTELQFSVMKLTHWSVCVCPSGRKGRPRHFTAWSPLPAFGSQTLTPQVQFIITTPREDTQNILYCTGSPSNYALCYVSHIMAVYWYECLSQCSILFCPTELWFSVVKLTNWSVSMCPSGSDMGHTDTDRRVSFAILHLALLDRIYYCFT